MGKVKDIDMGWKKIKDSLKVDCAALVGVQSDGKAREAGSGISNIDLAIIHEFGVPESGIPERSFIRSSFDNHRQEYVELLEIGGRKILSGSLIMDHVVGAIGEKAVSDIKNTMDEGIDPPLKYRVGTPLIDTAQLKNSLTVKVIHGDEADA